MSDTQDFPEILVLRHGETVWNRQGRMQGSLDSPLTPKGIIQAETQNDILKQLNLRGFQFFASPQGRAFETARIAFSGLTPSITTDADLCEIDMGAWAGKKRSDIETSQNLTAEDVNDFGLYKLTPGEGMAGLYTRAEAFLRRLTGPAVIVTHGMTSRCLRAIAMGKTQEECYQLPGGQGIVYRVENKSHQKV